MARKSFAQHFVPGLRSGHYENLPNLMSKRLMELSGMSQDVEDTAAGGPEWEYDAGKVRRTTKVGCTLSLAGGRRAYWSAAMVDHTEEPDWAQVQRHHAVREGCDFWLLTPAYLAECWTECSNRINGYYALAQAAEWDSRDVESRVLMKLDDSESLASLAEASGASVMQTYVASLRLWKRRLVRLPLESVARLEDWTVSRGNHGAR